MREGVLTSTMTSRATATDYGNEVPQELVLVPIRVVYISQVSAGAAGNPTTRVLEHEGSRHRILIRSGTSAMGPQGPRVPIC